MACNVYGRARGACGRQGCSELSSTYTKQYAGTAFSLARHRIAPEDGYRIAVNCDSNVSVSFTGTLLNSAVYAGTGSLFRSFIVYVRFFNVRLPSYKHVLSRVAVSLPYVADETLPPQQYFVPITLTGVAPLCSGIFQFDVLVYPFIPGTSSPCGPDGDDDSSSSSSSDDDTTVGDYTVTGCGNLSIEVVRKVL